MKKKRKTYAELQQQIKELEAQLTHVPYFAINELTRTSEKYLLGSGVLITMHGIGGKQLVTPFMVKDGLSQETIEALKADLRRTYELMVSFNPKNLKKEPK